jgi:hypothetical protein
MEEPVFKRIRCMHCPRYAHYDKVSKTRIYIDVDLDGEVINIAWKPPKHPKNEIYPQKDLRGMGMDFQKAAQFGLDVARSNILKK